MIERIYRCDLCRDAHELKALVAIEWRAYSKLVKSENMPTAEHHLCKRCISDIAKIAEREAASK